MAKNYFKSYIWLIETLQSHGHLTLKELQSLWMRSSVNDEYKELAPRTLLNHIQSIFDVFGVKISCDRSDNTYYIENEDEVGGGSIRSWMLEALSLNSLLNESAGMKDRIIFEDVPSSQKHLTTVIQAMRDNKVLEVRYKSYRKEEESDLILEPYCIRQHKSRWYLYAHKGSDAEPHMFSLDRFVSANIGGRSFKMPAKFNAHEFFSGIYGARVYPDMKPEFVTLKATSMQANYFRSLPLHSSQEEIERTDEYSVFRYFLTPDYDFVQDVLSFGTSVEILNPIELRENFTHLINLIKINMSKSFKELQYEHQYEVSQTHPEWFDFDGCFGTFNNKSYKFILRDSMNNLYEGLRTTDKNNPLNVLRYFSENGIIWWSGRWPSGHMCSSQIACVNHLFPIRYDQSAVLALANCVAEEAGELPFDDVLEVGGDTVMPGYIAFEVITSRDYLHESKDGKLSRGTQCTSVDATILAHRNDKVYVIPIEWKFAEEYNRDDKSKNIFDKKKGKWSYCGDERIRRYFKSGLVPNSKQIKLDNWLEIPGSVFFQEPFYQLMRQTLWAEQVVMNKDKFFKGASDYIHVHVVPQENKTLRDKCYRNVPWDKGDGMVATWKSNLQNPGKYVCIDPSLLFKGIIENKDMSSKYAGLLSYLVERYWK